MTNRILELLDNEDGSYVSGEALSRELNVSRTAIWKQIKKLEAQGYRIEASPRLGYRLAEKPSRLVRGELIGKLAPAGFVPSVKLLESVDSTQNVAGQLAEEGAPEGTLVIAEQQTSGRGRMGRSWISPMGKGVWMSMVLRPDIPLQFAPQLTLLTAVALCRALKSLAPLDIGIKWPNDLLIDGKKICGILLESTAEDERLRYVIAGIGISANLERSDYPAELLDKATSLQIELGRPVDRAEVIAAFVAHFERLYSVYRQEGFAPIRTLWEALSVSLHKPAYVSIPNGVARGVPVGLDERGALLVRLDDERLVPVFTGFAEAPSP